MPTLEQAPDLEHINRKDLRVYVLSHRDDEEALRLYMDRMQTDPDVVRHTGGFDQEGAAHLERLIQQQATKALRPQQHILGGIIRGLS
jgi:hypothetical protein